MPNFKKLCPAICLLMSFSVSAAGTKLSCMTSEAVVGGWSPSIILKNDCGKAIDLQGGLISFTSNSSVSGSFWGIFGSLAYPASTTLHLERQAEQYLVQLPLNFPNGNQWWQPNTKLPNGETIKVQFSGTPSNTINQIAVYTNTPPIIEKGQLTVQLGQQPFSQAVVPMITVRGDGGYEKKLALSSWQQGYTLKEVPYGTYQLSAPILNNGNTYYAPQFMPSAITINGTNNAVSTQVKYVAQQQTGSVMVENDNTAPITQSSSIELAVKDLTTQQNLPPVTVAWQGRYLLEKLTAGHKYQFSTTSIEGKINRYIPTFSPSSEVMITAGQTQTLKLSYQVQPLVTQQVNVTISGKPSERTVILSATDNQQHTYQKTTSANAASWSLPINRQYQFNASTISHDGKHYSASVLPSSFFLANDSVQGLNVAYAESANQYHFSPYVDVTLNNVTKWSSQYNSMQPTGLIDLVKDSGVNALHLAFITGQSGCQGTWAGYPVSDDAEGYGVPIFKQLKAQGVELTVALGGLSGQYLAQVCQSQSDLVAAYEKIIRAYQPYGLDFDVENDLQTNDGKLDRMMQAIKIIQQHHPELKISFTLPVLPSGLVSGVGENVVKRAAHNGLVDFNVNIMAMDYGSYFTNKTMAEHAISAASNTLAQMKKYFPEQSDETLWKRLEITPMIGLNDTLPLNFSINDASTLKSFAIEKGLGMLSIWSINRDHPCAKSHVNIQCSSANPSTGAANQNEDYQYTKTMMP